MTADAVGGVWTYALDLARGLKAHGIETVLAVTGPPPSESPSDLKVVATGLPLDWLADAPEQVEQAGRALADLAGHLAADVVQLNSPAYAAGGRFPVPVVGVQHSCTATWWRAVKGDAPWPEDFGWRYDLARRGLLACDRVVAPSAAFAAAVAEAYGIQPPAVVWNGRSPLPLEGGGGGGPRATASEADRSGRDPEGATATPAFRPDTPLSPPSPTLPPLRGKGVYVFTAGRLWDESKGIATLDAAAGRLSVPAFAAGPLSAPGSPDAAGFEHLRVTGMLGGPDLQARLAAAIVFVSPSLYEPFGLAVLEAAQLARPLVLSDIPTFRELWDGAAVFTPPGDAGALADALNTLLADPLRRAALGGAAEVRARRYTVEAMAAGMAGVFRSLRAS